MASGADSGGSSPSSVTSPVSRVKVVCTHNGHIERGIKRLVYTGYVYEAEVERDISYDDIISRLSDLCSLEPADGRVLKYQLPGADLDALVPVAGADDLKLMMRRYEELLHVSSPPSDPPGSPPPLRLYLDPPPIENAQGAAKDEDASGSG